MAGRGWAQSRRYEAPSAEPVGDAVAQDRRPGTVDRMDAWDELSRGEDPT
ncbi:Trp biosynthesis-associated membrane protein [uncultured Micrococcus sp.]|nr:Trp biosynthesis-associated membrane protein [uncultured Micrococcus sp.]